MRVCKLTRIYIIDILVFLINRIKAKVFHEIIFFFFTRIFISCDSLFKKTFLFLLTIYYNLKHMET